LPSRQAKSSPWSANRASARAPCSTASPGSKPPTAARSASARRRTDIVRLDEAARAALRASSIGFVFQAFHVLPTLTVAQNIARAVAALRRAGRGARAAHAGAARARRSGRLRDRWPASLSGGELQRVAIARALVHRPALILADEPTGNLDPRTAGEVLALLLERVREQQASALIVTHSQQVAQCCDRILTLTPDGLE
jgi:putative ABC transport system ATP-binding protein